jgi:hypothetical protein
VIAYIWIRTSVDWADEAAVLHQLIPAFRPKLERWNAVFTMSYQRFRHRVVEIAAANHAAVEAAIVTSKWDTIPDGALVLPVDDDDWFAPHAAQTLLNAIDANAVGWLWPARRIEVPIDLRHRLHLARRRLVPSLTRNWLCATNNYAMVKSSAVRPQLASHVKASRYFADTPAIVHIDRPLSIANRNLSSQTTLLHREPTIGRSLLIRKYRAYRRLYGRRLSPELAWATPYVEQMAALMSELETRRARGRRGAAPRGAWPRF